MYLQQQTEYAHAFPANFIRLNHRIQYVWFSQMPKTKFDDSFEEVKRWRVFLDLLRSYCYVGSACSFSCFVIVQLIHLLLVWDVGAHCNRRNVYDVSSSNNIIQFHDKNTSQLMQNHNKKVYSCEWVCGCSSTVEKNPRLTLRFI